MDFDLRARLDQLTPEQRALVERRMRLAGLTSPTEPLRVTRRDRPAGTAAASPSQEAFFAVQARTPGDATYNLPIAVHMRLRLDPGLLQRALDELYSRHEVLRTTLRLVSGELRQVIAAPARFPGLAAVDVGDAPDAEVEGRLAALAAAPFDLGIEPLIRVTLIQRSHHSVLVLNVHHAIFDGWSAAVFVRELHALYSAGSVGITARLPVPPLQYADYVEWKLERLRRGDYDRELAYWRQQLAAGSAPLRLPERTTELPPGQPQGRKRAVSIPAAQAEALAALGRSTGATLFSVVLAVFKAALFGLSGCELITVGVAEATRDVHGTGDTIGSFVNMLPMRTLVRPELSFVDLLARVHETALGAFNNKNVPFEHVVRELRGGWDARTPIQVGFALQNAPLQLPDVMGRFEQLDNGTTHFELALNLTPVAIGLEGFLEYRTSTWEEHVIDELLRNLLRLIRRVAATPERRLAALLFGADTAPRASAVTPQGGPSDESERFGI